MKLSTAQSTMLRIIANASKDGNDGVKGRFWYPQIENERIEGKDIIVSGASTAMAIKALRSKGLIIPIEKDLCNPYASRITEAGRTLAEQEKGKPLAWESYESMNKEKWIEERG